MPLSVGVAWCTPFRLLVSIVLLVLLTSCNDKSSESSTMARNQESADFAPTSDVVKTSQQMKTQGGTLSLSQSDDLPYELVPFEKALESGRLSGEVANRLAIGQMVHQDTMREILRDIEAMLSLHSADNSLCATLNVLHREAKEVRDVATYQTLAFDKQSGSIAILSKSYTDILESGFKSYGVVLPSTHWGYLPPFAREATQEDWQNAKVTRITGGKWSGAYMLQGKQIFLPGLQALGLRPGEKAISDLVDDLDREAGPELGSIARQLVTKGADAVPALVGVIKDDSESMRKRDHAIFVLGKIGPITKQVPDLFAWILTRETFDRRKNDYLGYLAEGRISSPELGLILATSVSDSRSEVRANALSAAITTGLVRSFSQVDLKNLLGDMDERVRVNAALAVGVLVSPNDALLDTLRWTAAHDHASMVRRAATQSLDAIARSR